MEYISKACKLARKYFRMVGLEIYPVNTDEYKYLHECGADYVTVFKRPTMLINTNNYLLGHKRVWPYRFDAQERALRGGMRVLHFRLCLVCQTSVRMLWQVRCTYITYREVSSRRDVPVLPKTQTDYQ